MGKYILLLVMGMLLTLAESQEVQTSDCRIQIAVNYNATVCPLENDRQIVYFYTEDPSGKVTISENATLTLEANQNFWFNEYSVIISTQISASQYEIRLIHSVSDIEEYPHGQFPEGSGIVVPVNLEQLNLGNFISDL